MSRRTIVLPRPPLAFPGEGWRGRLEAHVAGLGPRGSERQVATTEKALGAPLPLALRALLLEVDGAVLDFLSLFPLSGLAEGTTSMQAWQKHEQFLPDVSPDDVIAVAIDGAGNYYGQFADDRKSKHSVVYFCHDPPGWEHRFTTLGAFVESLSALVRAHASALWRKAETEAGDYVDDAPWTKAARRVERAIDPKLRRTRED